VLKKITSLASPNYKNLDWKTVFLILFLAAFFIRFPFFFRDYVDRDESTFIIMAQSWVNGHLPYTQLWDLKPPVTFLFFAVIIKIFGKSFMAIRLFGTLLVALTSLFTYGMATKITSKKVAFWVAMFCVFFQSLFGSLQGVMSEHICTFFFAAGTYLLLTKDHVKWYFLTGTLFGLSVMSKLNMVYPVLGLGIYFLWEGFAIKQFAMVLKKMVFMGMGFLFVLALTALPYYLEGHLQVWWQSIFEAPLAYSDSKFHSPLKALPFLLASTLFFYFGYKKELLNFRSKPIQILLIIFAGIMLSFTQTGKINGHYLIQVYPFVLIPFGIMIGKLIPPKKIFKPLAIVLLLLLPMEAYLEYVNIVGNKMEKGSFFNGEGVDVPKYIEAHHLDTQNIFFTEYHIGYWVLGVDPPTKAVTHPSNIAREELYPYMENPRKTGMEELRYIMDVLKPKTIVARKGKKIFDKKLVEYNAYIDAYLTQHYTLLATVDRGLIYQRTP
jgi:hypothetical protein